MKSILAAEYFSQRKEIIHDLWTQGIKYPPKSYYLREKLYTYNLTPKGPKTASAYDFMTIRQQNIMCASFNKAFINIITNTQT